MTKKELKIDKDLKGIKKNVVLAKYTTFQIGGEAKYFFEAKNKKDLIKAVGVAKKYNLPFFILGKGSNLLVADEGYKGIVIKIKSGKFKIHNSKIMAEAGIRLGSLVNVATKVSLSGLEWAVGIPGTAGGAIQGNAGAFGVFMKDVLKEVEIFDVKKNKIKILKNKDCNFSYRNSIFKKNHNLIILSCEIQLKKGNKQKIQKLIQENLNYRKTRHPKEPSAGSVFKNIELKTLKPKFFRKFPEAKKIVKENILPVAFLINQCNLKGKKINQAQVSKIHPNFIVNLGGAKAKDVLKLINLIKKKIKEKFGIELKEEIQYLGNFLS